MYGKSQSEDRSRAVVSWRSNGEVTNEIPFVKVGELCGNEFKPAVFTAQDPVRRCGFQFQCTCDIDMGRFSGSEALWQTHLRIALIYRAIKMPFCVSIINDENVSSFAANGIFLLISEFNGFQQIT